MTREIRILIAVVVLSFVGAYVWRDAILVDGAGNSLAAHEPCGHCGSKQQDSTMVDGRLILKCARCSQILYDYGTTQ